MKEKHKNMYMRIAESVAETSPAIRLKVGAVAVKNNMVIGTGYNALPSGINGECEYKEFFEYDVCNRTRDQFPYMEDGRPFRLVTKSEVRHAEANLILNAAKSTESMVGATVFCNYACCKFCAMDLVDSGISKFIYKNQYRSNDGLEYLKNNSIEVEQLIGYPENE